MIYADRDHRGSRADPQPGFWLRERALRRRPRAAGRGHGRGRRARAELHECRARLREIPALVTTLPPSAQLSARATLVAEPQVQAALRDLLVAPALAQGDTPTTATIAELESARGALGRRESRARRRSSNASPKFAPSSKRARSRAGRARRGRAFLNARERPRIVLASTSRYRRELLARLVADFRVVAPDVDETPQARRNAGRARRAGSPRRRRRAVAAGQHGRARHRQRSGRRARRPPDRQARQREARASRSSPRAPAARSSSTPPSASPIRASAAVDAAIDRTEVVFRPLSARRDRRATSITRTRSTPPAASRPKAPASRCSSASRSTDPTALIGLPLIALARLLRAAGFTLPWQSVA